MEPIAFLELAHSLANQADNEAAFRTSVSRSYYALFNLLNEFLVANKFSIPKAAKAHDTVYLYLHNSGIKGVCDVAKNLDDLRTDRNKADYELDLPDFQSTRCAVFSLTKARWSYKEFQKLTESRKKRQHVTKGVRAYIELIKKAAKKPGS